MRIRAWFRKLGGCEDADTLLEALRDCFRTVETLGRLDPDDEVIADVRARVDEYLGG